MLNFLAKRESVRQCGGICKAKASTGWEPLLQDAWKDSCQWATKTLWGCQLQDRWLFGSF